MFILAKFISLMVSSLTMVGFAIIFFSLVNLAKLTLSVVNLAKFIYS